MGMGNSLILKHPDIRYYEPEKNLLKCVNI
jgi:hypothetical protein